MPAFKYFMPLKVVFQAKLQIATAVLGRDFAERARCRIAVGLALRRRWHTELRRAVGAAPIRVIQPVERLRPELKPVMLRNRKRLEQRQVPVLESRTVIEVPRLVRECARGRRGEDRRSIAIFHAEPVVRVAAAVRESAVASGQYRIDIDLPWLEGRCSDAGIVGVAADCERRSRLELGNSGDRPSTEKGAPDTVG